MSDDGRNGTHPRAEISAWLDGDVEPARQAEIEAHLAACAACTALVEDLRGLATTASTLESRPPARDLWPAIRERLESRQQPQVIPLAPAPRRRGVSFTWSQLAAASVALVLLAGVSTWWVLTDRVGMPGGTPPMAERGAAPAEGTGEALLVADYADDTYDAAVADLEAALEASRDQLDPQTVATIERNLVIIDQAIQETRQALANDPGSAYLSAYLAEQMQRKLEVLRTATRVATT